MAPDFSSGGASVIVEQSRTMATGIAPEHLARFGSLQPRTSNWRLQAEGTTFESSSVWRVSCMPGIALKGPGSDPDIFSLGIVLQGQVDLTDASGGSMRFLPHESFHITSPAACTISSPRPARIILITALMGVLDEYGASIEAAWGRIEADPDLIRPIARFSEALIARRAVDQNLTLFLLERLLQDQLGALLLSSEGHSETETPPHETVYRRAKAIIKARHADSDFTPTALANDVNSSLRYLQKVFAHHGETVAVEIRNARAHHARTILQDPKYRALTRDQVARYSGFSSAHVMRRALSDCRQQA